MSLQKIRYSFRGIVLLTSLVTLALILMFATPAHADSLSRQLEVGMSGSDVSALQAYLATDASLYPEGLVTGYYGVLTRAAVMRFQSANGIPSVGRVGPLTLAALNARIGVGTNPAPTVSNISTNQSVSSATVSWTTNELATGIVYYSSSPITMNEASEGQNDVYVSGTAASSDTSLHTSHSITISGLSGNTTYYYVILAKDASGNVTVTLPASIRTN